MNFNLFHPNKAKIKIDVRVEVLNSMKRMIIRRKYFNNVWFVLSNKIVVLAGRLIISVRSENGQGVFYRMVVDAQLQWRRFKIQAYATVARNTGHKIKLLPIVFSKQFKRDWMLIQSLDIKLYFLNPFKSFFKVFLNIYILVLL